MIAQRPLNPVITNLLKKYTRAERRRIIVLLREGKVKPFIRGGELGVVHKAHADQNPHVVPTFAGNIQ